MFTPDSFVRVTSPDISPPVDSNPWAPFKTREDFEFAELMLKGGMPKAQINALISLFHKCIEKGKGSLTFLNHSEMQKTLDIASERLPKVCL